MKRVLEQWNTRNQRAESRLAEAFRFQNKSAPVVIVDANYWTFGDLAEEIPDDHYTEPASAFRYQMAKIERHFDDIPDDAYIPFLHPWYGTGVLASAFGIEVICNPKMDPAVGLSTMRELEEIDALPVPVPGESGVMPLIMRMLDYFKAHADLPVGFTDCQGPLSTALQIVGYDKFCYWMQDDPERIHKLMARVSDALIAWIRFQKGRAGQPLNGCCYPLSIKVPEGFGGVWLSDDDSVIMGAEHYNEFVRPYNERVLAAFGGGCIHYCGNSTQNIENYCNTRGVTAINNFTLDNFEAATKIRRALRDKGIVYMACDFAPAEQRLSDYYRELRKAMDGTEGLIVGAYIAPAIALDKGSYTAASRNRVKLARRIFELTAANFAQ
ncbi:MAG: uroporphyrinogen decarboxylase family protein [bacterium]